VAGETSDENGVRSSSSVSTPVRVSHVRMSFGDAGEGFSDAGEGCLVGVDTKKLFCAPHRDLIEHTGCISVILLDPEKPQCSWASA
jgi:hypothetical protein